MDKTGKNKKPGSIVQVRSSVSYRKAQVLIGEINRQNFGWPEKKEISDQAVGFITRTHPEDMFDWLVEVAFPEEQILGWVSIADLNALIPSEFEDHLDPDLEETE